MKNDVTVGQVFVDAFVDFVRGCTDPFNVASHGTEKYAQQAADLKQATAGMKEASAALKASLSA